MPFNSRYIFVEGESTSEAQVRPHNWAERFAGNLANYGADRRLRYSSLLEPVVYNGTRSLRICKTLEDSNPEMVREILGFAEQFGLPVHGMAAKLEISTVVNVEDDVLAKAS
jgi:hypothetical protein